MIFENTFSGFEMCSHFFENAKELKKIFLSPIL